MLEMLLALSHGVVVFADPDRPRVQITARARRLPTDDLVGLSAFGDLIAWLEKLPKHFDSFVSSQKREQLHRRFLRLSDAFGKVNNECVTLALLTKQDRVPDEQLYRKFDGLQESIIALRLAMLELAKDLDEEVGNEGRDLAFQLSTVTMMRANMTMEARQQVLGGNRKDAAIRLYKAAQLAERAQKTILSFLPHLR